MRARAANSPAWAQLVNAMERLEAEEPVFDPHAQTSSAVPLATPGPPSTGTESRPAGAPPSSELELAAARAELERELLRAAACLSERAEDGLTRMEIGLRRLVSSSSDVRWALLPWWVPTLHLARAQLKMVRFSVGIIYSLY